jgi:hypothetical protein
MEISACCVTISLIDALILYTLPNNITALDNFNAFYINVVSFVFSH